MKEILVVTHQNIIFMDPEKILFVGCPANSLTSGNKCCKAMGRDPCNLLRWLIYHLSISHY